MLKRKPKRSREFRKNNKVIDIDEAREQRREKREQRLLQEREKALLAEEKKLSARKKKQKRNRRMAYFCAALFAVVLILYCVWDIAALHMEKNEVMAQQEALLAEKEALQKELANVNDPEYIEQQARVQLRLIMPGEILYVLPDLDEKTDNIKKDDENISDEKSDEEKSDKWTIGN